MEGAGRALSRRGPSVWETDRNSEPGFLNLGVFHLNSISSQEGEINMAAQGIVAMVRTTGQEPQGSEGQASISWDQQLQGIWGAREERRIKAHKDNAQVVRTVRRRQPQEK